MKPLVTEHAVGCVTIPMLLTYSTKGKLYLEEMGIRPQQVAVCYNGLEIDDLLAREPQIRSEAESVREELEASDRTVFLYVGGMITDKRVELLLHAFKAIESERDDCMLWLIGDGPQRAPLPCGAERAEQRGEQGNGLHRTESHGGSESLKRSGVQVRRPPAARRDRRHSGISA